MLEISHSLKLTNPEHRSCHQWLKDIYEMSAFVGAILSVIHPDLYESGIKSLEAIAEKPEHIRESEEDVLDILRIWGSPFNVLSVISNRECPFHRDVNARIPWYDILCSFGTYTGGRMELPGFGIRLAYDPGSMVGLAGRVVRHGVSEAEGERVCLTYFMRDAVQEKLQVRAGHWMNVSKYESCIVNVSK